MYKLYDMYREPIHGELVGRFRTMEDVKQAALRRDRETGGEWEPLLKKNGNVILKWRYC